MNISLPSLAISLAPVAALLGGLVYMDSYRLVKLRAVLVALGAGLSAALVALVLNRELSDLLGMEVQTYSRYVAPILEESLKASYLLVLILRGRVGFMVDAAIYGFAIGTGFSLVENIAYMQAISSQNLLLWAVRGFGTALMHAGTTAMVGVLAREIQTRTPLHSAVSIGAGLLLASVIHSIFNHFFLSPALSALATLVGVPLVMYLVYSRSEQRTREWLGVGFDTDRELYEMITTGLLAENKVGQYLSSLEQAFPPASVADMLCYLRIYTELAIRAKAVLMLRDAGLPVLPDPESKEKFEELRYLEGSIGKTGLLALHPFLHTRGKDLWQLHMAAQ